MCLAGAMLGTSDHMIADIGATYNFSNIDFACTLGTPTLALTKTGCPISMDDNHVNAMPTKVPLHHPSTLLPTSTSKLTCPSSTVVTTTRVARIEPDPELHTKL